MKTALVYGYGSMGRRHAHHARQLGWGVSVAESDHAQRQRAAEDGFDVRNRDTDVVIIATPAHGHAQLLAEAQKHGRPVFVEKPLGLSVTDVAGWTTSDDHVQVGYNLRFHSGILAL